MHRAAPRGARPGQRGAVVRSADAVGASGVAFTETSVDPYNPKTVRATAGSIFPLPIVRGVDTLSAIESVRDRGARVLAMAAEEHPTSTAPICPGGSRSCSATRPRPAADDRRGGRRYRPGAPVRKGGSLQPRRGGDGLPVRVAAPAPAIGGGARRHHRGCGARHPITAHRDEGVRLRPRDAVGRDDRGATHADAARHRARRPHGHDPPSARRRRSGCGGSLETFREQVVVSELVGTVVDSLGRDPDHPSLSGSATTRPCSSIPRG